MFLGLIVCKNKNIYYISLIYKNECFSFLAIFFWITISYFF
jgi:hypothetical protein